MAEVDNSVEAIRAELIAEYGTDYGASDAQLAALITRAGAYTNLKHTSALRHVARWLQRPG